MARIAAIRSPSRIVEVDYRDPDVAAYAATYLLPFVTVFTGAWQDVVSLGGFVAVLGVIYVRSRLIYVNPTLSLLGYHLTRVIYTTPARTIPIGRAGRATFSRGRRALR